MAVLSSRAPSSKRLPSLTALASILGLALLVAGLGISRGSGSSTGGVEQYGPSQGPGEPAGASAGGPTQQGLHISKLLRHWDVTPERVWVQMLSDHPAPATATVVEVGSWNGAQCKQALDASFGSVVCFEPGPINWNRTVDVLKDSLKDPRLRLEQKVVGNVTGEKIVFRNTGSTGDHAGAPILGEVPAFQDKQHEVLIESVSLDDFFTNATADNPIFLAKIDTQGFDGVVLQGMARLLREHAVHTVMMELWPTAMSREGARPCEETLLQLLEAGYEVYETGLKVIPGEEPPSKEEWVQHPTEPAALCQWYRQHSGKFGLWTDIIAVAPQASR